MGEKNRSGSIIRARIDRMVLGLPPEIPETAPAPPVGVVPMKRCSCETCWARDLEGNHLPLPWSEFSFDRRHASGLQSQCKTCIAGRRYKASLGATGVAVVPLPIEGKQAEDAPAEEPPPLVPPVELAPLPGAAVPLLPVEDAAGVAWFVALGFGPSYRLNAPEDGAITIYLPFPLGGVQEVVVSGAGAERLRQQLVLLAALSRSEDAALDEALALWEAALQDATAAREEAGRERAQVEPLRQRVQELEAEAVEVARIRVSDGQALRRTQGELRSAAFEARRAQERIARLEQQVAAHDQSLSRDTRAELEALRATVARQEGELHRVASWQAQERDMLEQLQELELMVQRLSDQLALTQREKAQAEAQLRHRHAQQSRRLTTPARPTPEITDDDLKAIIS